MKVADHMPTAVDYTNILVNYLEVSPDHVLQQHKSPPTEHLPAEYPPTKYPATDHPRADPPQQQYIEPVIPEGLHPPQTLSPAQGQELGQGPPQRVSSPVGVSKSSHSSAPREPPKKYHSDAPRYLRDLDAAEEDPRFHRASAVLQTLPVPPSLPLMLSKSILNGSTPVKDDASVLIMPNHTVLNHLATSSIKDNVLATSGTTRYKRKVSEAQVHRKPDDGHTGQILLIALVSHDDHVQTNERSWRLTEASFFRCIGERRLTSDRLGYST